VCSINWRTVYYWPTSPFRNACRDTIDDCDVTSHVFNCPSMLLLADRRPPPPVNVSVKQQRTGLLLTWLPPPSPTRHWPDPPGSFPALSPVQHHSDPVTGYLIQYRTVGQWVDLTPDRLPSDRTWYEWKTASRGANYQFRVLSYSADGQYSNPSPTLSFRTGGQSRINCSTLTVLNSYNIIDTKRIFFSVNL